jgi:hypothetical protein
MQIYNLPKEQVCDMRCIIYLMACNEIHYLRKPINHNKNRVSIFFDLGKPKIKSIDINSRSVGTDNGVYSLCGCTLDVVFLRAMHYSQICCTFLFIFGQ